MFYSGPIHTHKRGKMSCGVGGWEARQEPASSHTGENTKSAPGMAGGARPGGLSGVLPSLTKPGLRSWTTESTWCVQAAHPAPAETHLVPGEVDRVQGLQRGDGTQ